MFYSSCFVQRGTGLNEGYNLIFLLWSNDFFQFPFSIDIVLVFALTECISMRQREYVYFNILTERENQADSWRADGSQAQSCVVRWTSPRSWVWEHPIWNCTLACFEVSREEIARCHGPSYLESGNYEWGWINMWIREIYKLDWKDGRWKMCLNLTKRSHQVNLTEG